MTPGSAVSFSLDPLRDGIAIATSGYSIGNSTLMTSTGCIGTTRLHDSQVPNGANWYLAAMHIVGGNSGGPVYRVEDGKVIGVCKGYGARPVRDENREPQPLFFNAGITLIVPARYVVDLLARDSVSAMLPIE